MPGSVPLLWIPAGLIAGLLMAVVWPLPVTLPLWVLLIPHVIVIFHIALAHPLMSLGRATGQGRVWRAVIAVNVVAVPILAFVLSRVVWHTPELQIGLLLAILGPGVALSIPIIRGAGGDAESVLGLAPVLLGVQVVVVPVVTVVMSGGALPWSVLPGLIGPVAAVVGIPVGLAAIVQWLWGRTGRVWQPPALPRLTVWWAVAALWLTAWDRGPALIERISDINWVVPLSIALLVLLAPVSLLAAGLVGAGVDQRRAILIFSVGRGGLVMLPVSLLLDPDTFGLVVFAVMAQVCVEAIGLLVYRSITPQIVEDTRR